MIALAIILITEIVWTPPQRAIINVYNLHFSLVKIYNTIRQKKEPNDAHLTPIETKLFKLFAIVMI